MCVVKRGAAWCVRGEKGFGYDRLRVPVHARVSVCVNVCARVSLRLRLSVSMSPRRSLCTCKRKLGDKTKTNTNKQQTKQTNGPRIALPHCSQFLLLTKSQFYEPERERSPTLSTWGKRRKCRCQHRDHSRKEPSLVCIWCHPQEKDKNKQQEEEKRTNKER